MDDFENACVSDNALLLRNMCIGRYAYSHIYIYCTYKRSETKLLIVYSSSTYQTHASTIGRLVVHLL